MRVIGVAGQARFGKDCLADRLVEKLNVKIQHKDDLWRRVGFADNVKRVYCENFDVTNDFIEEWKVKQEIPVGFDMQVRQSLQFIGDGFRKIRKNIWVDLVFRDAKPKAISDVRYPSEFIRVKQEGGLNILIGRPDKLNDDINESESLIRPYVDWALAHNEENVNLLLSEPSRLINSGCPKHMNQFDLFIRNDRTLEDFYEKIDKMVVPFVEKFNFK